MRNSCPVLVLALLGCGRADADGDGYTSDVDCDDYNAEVYPGAADTWYDGVNSDCERKPAYDEDGDGVDVEEAGGDDCNDTDPTIYGGAPDTWYDGIDSDCAGNDDYDQDGDGHGTAQGGGTDCDDEDASIYPGAPDTWYDGLDSDCAGNDDYDQDGDGFFDERTRGDDCDDTNASVYPGAPDAWYDGIDSDCEGNSDYDQDGDGYSSADARGDDCDDTDSTIYPAAPDTCYDGTDSNCSGGPDLVGYWPFDDHGSPTATDWSGNGNDGRLVGDAAWIDGAIGGAVELDGTGDYVDMGDVLGELALPVTLGAWIRADGDENFTFLTTDDADNVYSGLWLQVTGDAFYANFGDGTGSSADSRRSALASGVPRGEWVHLAAVIRGGTDMDVYVDGAAVPPTYSGSGGALVSSLASFRVGRDTYGGAPLDALGAIDELRVYDCELTAEDVARIATP